MSVVVLASLSLSEGLNAACIKPEINLNFNNSFSIDRSKFSNYDKSKPFYFNVASASSAAPSVFTVDKGTVFDVWLDAKVPNGNLDPGDRSLGFKISSVVDENVKDKIVLGPVKPKSVHAINLEKGNTSRFLEFSMMLDPNYEVPRHNAIHLQVWQCCGGHPPFTIRVTPQREVRGPVELTFNVANDASEELNYGKSKVLYRQTIQRGEWNRFVLRLEPSVDNESKTAGVDFWMNGQSKFSYRGPWGYQPNRLTPRQDAKLTGEMGISLGIYRRRQTTTQIVYFDDINYGQSSAVAEVNPNELFCKSEKS